MSKTLIPLHTQVRTKRRELDIKQSYLAEKSELSQTLISRFENGKHTNIGMDNFRKICNAIGFYGWDMNLTGEQL